MIKLKKVNYNLILGILLGFILAQIVLIQGYAVIADEREISTGLLSADSTSFIMRRFQIVAAIIFFSTIALFNTKRFKRINLNRISIYLILVILVSIVVATQGTIFIIWITFRIYPNIQEFINKSNFILVNTVSLIVFIAIALFLLTFVLLANRKVNYIKFLTKEVKKIKNEGFGKTIKLKGGDELAELCKSINDMSIELGEKIENEKKIEKNKNELITNVSHDLKTPLTSIVGYLELLNDNNIDENLKNQYIGIAYNKSLRLKSLVNELFEYTKLASNDIKLEKNIVNIAMLLNQSVGESIINFSEKNIEVVLDNPYNEVLCNVDAVQILRVFENLINNAEKYSDSNSKFIVSLKKSHSKILVSFTNKCEKIEEKDLNRLFERFYREDKSRNKEGTGLGLAIVKRIIDLHEGNITVQKIGNDIEFNIILNEA